MKFKSCNECPAKVLCKNTSRVDWGYGGLECVKFLSDMGKKLKSDNNAMHKIADDIECARDWLMPGRPVKQIEIDNCVKELHSIIAQLRQ